MHGHRMARRVALALAIALAAGGAGAVEVGAVVPEAPLRTPRGEGAPVVDPTAKATALLFVKPGQERSEGTLRSMARCQERFAGKAVRWVGVIPAGSPPAEAERMVAESGMHVTLLVDEGDALYAALGVRMHPGIAVVDRARKVVAWEPFHQVDYCDAVAAQLRHALGELSVGELRRALEPAPTRLPGDDPAAVARRHLALGRKLLDAKAHGPALEEAKKALALAPSADAWALLGEAHRAAGRCPDALKAFDAALTLDAGHPAAAAGAKACR